jgi:hypothetical protein
MILVGFLALFFGDRQIPVRGGTVLKIFDRQPRHEGEGGDFSKWPYKYLFGGAFIVVGLMLTLKASKV